MKFVVIKNNLKEGLGVVEKASGENLNLPILKNVLIESQDNNIKLTTTNLEIAINYYVSGKTIENGKVTIPISVFLNIINNLQTERLNLEKKNQNLEIKTDNYEAIIQGLPPEEFPIIPKIKNNKEFLEIKTELFKEVLGQTISSAQFSDLRPELNSVLFSFSLDALKIVATDSFRLSERTLPINQFTTNHKQEFKILIPLKTSQELFKILKENESLKIYHDQNQILFTTDRFEFISRLVEGVFPEYEAIIPKKFETEIVLDREEFINAIKATSALGSRTYEVRIKIPESKKNIEVFSIDQVIGENKYFLPAKIQGRPKEISFNWRYLLDGLKALKTKNVFLGANEENKPVLIKSPNETYYFYILMPILKT
jgi:DNA polymerase-3 subunit beta